MAMKFHSVMMAPPILSASQPPSGRDSEPTSGPRKAMPVVTAGNRVLIAAGRGGVANERTECPDVNQVMIHVCLRQTMASWSRKLARAVTRLFI